MQYLINLSPELSILLALFFGPTLARFYSYIFKPT
ncbi:hypothetical protein EZJ58_0355 [Sodalis ligni]|uniref:Uncharacterized protein n=1 Tax=Sodalis ligni TaxID=2697027 RepID=A0A4R1N5G9_9GAMM|nr:hypothetical protein EZJ58_0355 [Sodalis ligni]